MSQHNIGCLIADESAESEQQFSETIQQTLGSLAQNAEDLHGEMSEQDLMRAMSGLGLGAGEEGGSSEQPDMDFMPLMQNMMKNLLSKEVLYPSLKEISEKVKRIT